MTDFNESKGFYDNMNLGFGGKGSNSDYNMPIKKTDYVKDQYVGLFKSKTKDRIFIFSTIIGFGILVFYPIIMELLK